MGKLSAPFSEIITRLAYHTLAAQSPARLLDGWDWDPIPVVDVVGVKNFPYLRMFAPIGAEVFTPRDIGQANLSLDFALLSGKSEMLGLPEHMVNLEKFTDALRLMPETALRADASLNRTTISPFKWSIATNSALDISFFMRITVSIESHAYKLGSSRT